MKWFVLLVASLVCVSNVDAGIFGWRRVSRSCPTGTCATGAVQKTAVQKTDAVQKESPVQKTEATQKDAPKAAVQKSETVSDICLRKARIQASRGRMFHVGGGFGPGRAEGVGFSTSSAQAALNACCFTGQRVCIGSAVVRGARGWYACKIYR